MISENKYFEECRARKVIKHNCTYVENIFVIYYFIGKDVNVMS